jgi:hypothetical protein
MDNDFDSVSWQNDEPGAESQPSAASKIEPGEPVYGANASGKRKNNHNQAGEQADAVDLAGVEDAFLNLKVDCPLTENNGTKDAYVSYLVTTKVRLGSACRPRTIYMKSDEIITDILRRYRPTSNHLPNQPPKSAGASPTLSSSTNSSPCNIHNAPFPLYQTSTRWSTFEETASALTSPKGGRILSTAFLNASPFTPNFGAPHSS